MSEDNNDKKKAPDKIVDVTKPKQPSTPMASIDTTRVSAYTLREQQALERLKKQVGNLDQRENRMSNVKTIVAILLVVILIAIAIIFVIIIGKNTSSEEKNYDIRVSMKIENKSALSIITDTGKEELREINPGDRIPLSAFVRNSTDYRGDSYNPDTETPRNIYVRFKIVLILDYAQRFDIIVPTTTGLWYRYSAEDEAMMNNGVTEDDHYYYYKGSLAFLQRAELFSDIKFDGNTLTCDDGGKYGQIQVVVESIDANADANAIIEQWQSAPRKWVLDVTRV